MGSLHLRPNRREDEVTLGIYRLRTASTRIYAASLGRERHGLVSWSFGEGPDL